MTNSVQAIEFMAMAKKMRSDNVNKISEWRANKPGVIPLIGFDEKLQRREELIQMINYLDSEKKVIDGELKDYLNDAGASAAENNNYRILFREVCSSRLDATRLKGELPTIYEKYLKGTTSRRLVVQAV